MVEALFVALLDDIAEAFGGDEGGSGTFPLDQALVARVVP
jgi:hypothetical protein